MTASTMTNDLVREIGDTAPMTFDEWSDIVAEIEQRHWNYGWSQTQRQGQELFNTLSEHRPDLAELVRGS